MNGRVAWCVVCTDRIHGNRPAAIDLKLKLNREYLNPDPFFVQNLGKMR
jgi:hypothetical protein